MRSKIVLVFLLAAASAQGQGTKVDYERAFGLRGKFNGKVKNADLKPHWLGGHDFWYERALPDGREFVLVDGESGEKQTFADKKQLDAAVQEREPEEQTKEEKKSSRRRQRGGAGSPDGRWRASVRDHNVYVSDVEEGGEIQLSDEGKAEDGFVDGFHWSPDSKWVAVMRRKSVGVRKVHYVDSAPDEQLQPRHFTRDYAKPGDELTTTTVHVFEAGWDGRRFTPDAALVANPFNTRSPRWRHDSAAFTFEHVERGFGVHRVVEIAVPSGKSRALIDEVSDTFVHVYGKGYRKDLPDSDEILWRSERDGWNHLYLYDAKTGEVKSQLTKGEWVVREVGDVDERARTVTFSAGGREPGQDPYYLHFYRVNFDGTGLVRLTDGDGTHSVRWSPDRTVLVDTWSRVDLPPKHALRRASDGSLVCHLGEADASALFAAGFRAPERFVAKGRDGKFDIHGIISRPSNFDPEKKYPVVEVIYAGPHGAFVPKRWRTSYGMWRGELAELGFITVQIDGKGTAHRGREFQHFAYKNINDSGFPDRIAWMRAAAEKYPEMDVSRVGIYGGSAGGQSALAALIWHGDFYKAAAADCGCHDNRMDKIWWNEQWMDWPIGDHYAANSNVTHAAKLQGDLLLTVGELDKNVDPASTMQVVNALIKADKDFELCIVPGAGHGVGESPYLKRRRTEFFQRSLGGPVTR